MKGKRHQVRTVEWVLDDAAGDGVEIIAGDGEAMIYTANDRAGINIHLLAHAHGHASAASGWVGSDQDRMWVDTGQTTVFLPLATAQLIASMVEEKERADAEAEECAKAGCNGDHSNIIRSIN